MSHKKALARRQERRKTRFERITRALVSNLAYLFLAGAVLLFAVVVVSLSRQIPASNAGSSATATRAAATVNAGSGWIRLASKTPNSIIAAARQSSLFNVDRSGNGDYLKDLSHLETPVLVRALQMPGGVVMPDYYVIPIDDTSGAMVGAAELALNATHTSVQLTAIITYTHPHTHGQLAHVGQAAALSDLSGQRRVGLRTGAQPQLVYIAVDATAQDQGKITWNAGGEYPADPVWLIPGADGQNHVVGTDGLAYSMSDLPVLKHP